MNPFEKKSFYSFLSLYIISSTLFILISGYWYYSAQKNALKSNQYHKLQHIADSLSQKIIYAHMQGVAFRAPKLDSDIQIALIHPDKSLYLGSLIAGLHVNKADYFEYNGYNILISDAPQMHLNIEYVVIQSNLLTSQIKTLQYNVLVIMVFSIAIMVILAIFLSKLFMKPLQQKIKQIEDFVHDTAHELNTPITALNMSVSRALKKEQYDAKILKNISISSKQLYDIYTSLSYLSFETTKEEELHSVNVCDALEKSVEYYRELAESKRIQIDFTCKAFEYKMDEQKLKMLFGNLINNAIKYSHPNSTISITCKDKNFSIKDSGIGIDKERLSHIFERFNRETEYAGGFGIGLNIVQKIVKEYDLGLHVESTLGEGSTFFIRF